MPRACKNNTRLRYEINLVTTWLRLPVRAAGRAQTNNLDTLLQVARDPTCDVSPYDLYDAVDISVFGINPILPRPKDWGGH